jgi:hypothetical protein
MDVLNLFTTLVAPTAIATLTVGVAAFLLIRHLNNWRTELLRGIAVEVKRDIASGAPEVRVSSPLMTEVSDPFMTKSVCDLHHHQYDARLTGLTTRVERLEHKLDNDIRRLHERVDELPHRMVEMLKPLLKD